LDTFSQSENRISHKCVLIRGFLVSLKICMTGKHVLLSSEQKQILN